MVNGLYPTSQQTLVLPGYSDSPVAFEWKTNKEKAYDTQYRYGLFYTDEGFSQWSSETRAIYSFIYPGIQTFRVQTRYRRSAGEPWQEASEASFTFSLPRAFVSGMVVKGYGSIVKGTQQQIIPDLVYKRSIAVIVPVSKFDHIDQWQPLPFTRQDAQAIGRALAAKHFEIHYLESEPTSQVIINFIDQIANTTELGDRVVLYFSTHGFKDRNSGHVYLASSDCDPDKVNTTCISLAFVQDALTRIQRKAKHSLVILDACSAGLGIITKNLGVGPFYEGAMLREPGAHMITAGMADQEARLDANSDMSEFTKFLVAGIGGAADYNKDGVVTLLELMTYVRSSVAKNTAGEQIPMIGRVFGIGEIMF